MSEPDHLNYKHLATALTPAWPASKGEIRTLILSYSDKTHKGNITLTMDGNQKPYKADDLLSSANKRSNSNEDQSGK